MSTLSDQFKDMFGHMFKIVAMSWFPYIDFHPSNDISGSVILRDSLDARTIDTISSKINSTYVPTKGVQTLKYELFIMKK